MVRTISATEAKVNFGAVSRQVIETDEPVIVESHGQPKVAIVPVEQLDRLHELEDRERQQTALANLRQLQNELAIRNQDLTEEQADAIADELVRAGVDSLFERGIVRYGK